MPVSLRPVSLATTACPPSWAMVTTILVIGHSAITSTNASAASSATVLGVGTGWGSSTR